MGGLARGTLFRWDWESLRDIHVKTTRKKVIARGIGFTKSSETHCWNSGRNEFAGTEEGDDIVTGSSRKIDDGEAEVTDAGSEGRGTLRVSYTSNCRGVNGVGAGVDVPSSKSEMT